MAELFDKWLNSFRNDLEIWEMAEILGTDLDIWGTA